QAKEILGHRPLWAFRGHRDASWDIETTLTRNAMRTERRLDTLRQREDWILHQFRRFAHHYYQELPEERAILDWLALIQHYGGPTRLLDFTHSFYVSAFFAVEMACSDAVVWAIDLMSLDLANSKTLGIKLSGSSWDVRQTSNASFHASVADSSPQVAVIAVEPEHSHERLWTQQGLFLAPLNLSQSFLSNLALS